MTKDKRVSLEKYVKGLVQKLADPTPSKHKGHPETYKNFLKREIAIVIKQLEEDRLGTNTK